jgi:hypothetical protein
MYGGIFKIVFAASVIEAYFYNAATTFTIAKGEIGQPIVHIHPVATSAGTIAMTFTTSWSTIFTGTTTSTTHMFQFSLALAGDEIK